jgi:hypothetical protein
MVVTRSANQGVFVIILVVSQIVITAAAILSRVGF